MAVGGTGVGVGVGGTVVVGVVGTVVVGVVAVMLNASSQAPGSAALGCACGAVGATCDVVASC